MQLKESGIPLIIGIQNPSFTDKDLSPVADATARFWANNNSKREEKQEKGWGSFPLILPLSFCHEMKAQNLLLLSKDNFQLSDGL